MRKFWKDQCASIAVEFAILAPLLATMAGGLLVVIQGQNLNNASTFAAQSSAAVGARQLKQQLGAIAAATSADQTTFTADQSIFTLGASGSIVSITALDAGGATTSDDTKAVSLQVSVAGPAVLLPCRRSKLARGAKRPCRRDLRDEARTKRLA